jgi:hypothetical protein
MTRAVRLTRLPVCEKGPRAATTGMLANLIGIPANGLISIAATCSLLRLNAGAPKSTLWPTVADRHEEKPRGVVEGRGR